MAKGQRLREYLAVLDDAAFGGATPVAPKQLAVADLPPAGAPRRANGPSSLTRPII
jgi:hypothetical protein